jgi:hypothetical protein
MVTPSLNTNGGCLRDSVRRVQFACMSMYLICPAVRFGSKSGGDSTTNGSPANCDNASAVSPCSKILGESAASNDSFFRAIALFRLSASQYPICAPSLFGFYMGPRIYGQQIQLRARRQHLETPNFRRHPTTKSTKLRWQGLARSRWPPRAMIGDCLEGWRH